MVIAETGNARARILRAVLDLLRDGDESSVTTRRVGELAHVPAPTIYRLFGDKQGLLDAAVEHGYDTWIRGKAAHDTADDPVAALRDGWDDAVQFALDHPALYRIAQVREPSAVRIGHELLAEKIHRVARAGRLRVPEADGMMLMRAATRGLILELLDSPDDPRVSGLAILMREVIVGAIVDSSGPEPADGMSAQVVRVAATVSDTPGFTPGERVLVGELLERLARAESSKSR